MWPTEAGTLWLNSRENPIETSYEGEGIWESVNFVVRIPKKAVLGISNKVCGQSWAA
jgi:hypothetical protein